MAGTASWRSHLIAAQLDRCSAFADYLRQLEAHDYGTELSKALIRFLSETNREIRQQIESLGADPDFALLQDSEAESQIVRYSVLYNYLHATAALVESADVGATVVEMIWPFRRLLSAALQEADILLYPMSDINYSFFPLGQSLREVAERLNIVNGAELPAHLYAIGFPGLHRPQFLFHALLGHEMGHVLYLELKLADKLMPIVPVPKDDPRLGEHARRISEAVLGEEAGTVAEQAGPTQLSLAGFLSVRVAAALSRQVTETFNCWLKEIACDAIGFYLLGPAFLFSAAMFLPVLHQLDIATNRYPPTRLRLRLLFRLLNWSITGRIRDLRDDTRLRGLMPSRAADFLESWRAVAMTGAPPAGDLVHTLTQESLEPAFQAIAKRIQNEITPVPIYRLPQDADALKTLQGRIEMNVPPNELGYQCDLADLPSILNAGWFSFLSYADQLAAKEGWELWKAKQRIHGWVAKAVELQEISRRWGQIAAELDA